MSCSIHPHLLCFLHSVNNYIFHFSWWNVYFTRIWLIVKSMVIKSLRCIITGSYCVGCGCLLLRIAITTADSYVMITITVIYSVVTIAIVQSIVIAACYCIIISILVKIRAKSYTVLLFFWLILDYLLRNCHLLTDNATRWLITTINSAIWRYTGDRHGCCWDDSGRWR